MAPVERVESSARCLFACPPNPCSASTILLPPPRRCTDGVPRRRCARICSRHGTLGGSRRLVAVSRAATESDPDACHPAVVRRCYSGHGSNRTRGRACQCQRQRQPGPGCSERPAGEATPGEHATSRRMCAWRGIVGASARQDLRGRVNKWQQLDQLRPADAACLCWRWPVCAATVSSRSGDRTGSREKVRSVSWGTGQGPLAPLGGSLGISRGFIMAAVRPRRSHSDLARRGYQTPTGTRMISGSSASRT
jgi:hypothetical protein